MTDEQIFLDPEDPENPENPEEPTEPTDPEEPGGGEEPGGEETPNENLVAQIKDVSGMFNERGFYKANEFSYSENELINDFNGNLIYNIPLYRYKQAGDLNVDIKLNYNGSVGHSFRVGSYENWVYGMRDRFNINFPEWILSLNGMAVQVFNFETKYFNKPENGNSIEGYKLNTLIPGYHYTNDNRVIQSGVKDTITLLAGDGSTITLENDEGDGDFDNEDNYIGNYSQKGKESYMKAKVAFIDDNSFPHYYRRRRIKLLRGDGIEFIYEEDKNNFKDFVDTAPNHMDGRMKFKPLIPLLTEIRDRFGYSTKLTYTRWVPNGFGEILRGRPLLDSITAQGFKAKQGEDSVVFSFTYGTRTVKITHDTELNGEFNLIFEDLGVNYRDEQTPSINTDNQIGYLSRIINPLGQEISINYEEYTRKYINVNINPFPHNPYAINFNMLKRIKSFNGYLGLNRTYKYKRELDEIEVNIQNLYNEDPDEHITSADSQNSFLGYGRDPFFNNMVTEKIESIANNSSLVQKNKHTFNYTADFATRPEGGYKRYPIHEDDFLYTKRTIVSLDPETINETDSYIEKDFEYKIYPLYDPNNSFAYNPDTDGATKLFYEKMQDSQTLVEKFYKYYKGFGNPLNGGYNGSFLIEEKKEKVNGIEKIWKWSYVHKDGNVNKYITQSKETDPDNIVTVKSFLDFDECIEHTQFSNEYTNVLPTITSRYYIFNLLLEEYKYKIGNENIHLNKKVLTYITDPNSTLGYLGQLIKEEVFENGTTAKIITEYKYYKNDVTAKVLLYQTCGIYPYKEGNLSEIISSNGEVTKYYYHPIDPEEVYQNTNPNTDEPPGIPFLKYFVLYKDGQKEEEHDKIWDHRLPIRIDKCLRVNNNDTIISKTYKEYSLDGNPVKSIDENKMLTSFKYGKGHRIWKITLPGDFSSEQDTTETYVANSYEADDIVIKSIAWGSYGKNDGAPNDLISYSNVISRILSSTCMNFRTKVDSTNLTPDWRYAYIHFNKEDFLGIGNISQAKLVLRPISYTQEYNGIEIQNRKIALRMVYFLNRHPNVRCGYADPGFEDFYDKSVSPYSAVFDFNITNLASCEFTNIQILDIKDFLINFFQIYGNPGNFGIAIYPEYPPETPDFFEKEDELDSIRGLYSKLNLICNTSAQTWTDCSPRILISAIYNIYNIRPVFKSGTITYTYNDEENLVNVYSIRNLNTNDKGRIRYYFDSYGNIKRKDIFVEGITDESEYNSYYSEFNYLNLPAINTDAAGNITRLSYDGLQRLIKTQNADGSSNSTVYSYQNTLTDYFGGTFIGFIEKQVFKDENNNEFHKYFDAFGNLRREVKFISAIPAEEDDPENPEEITPLDPGEGDALLIHLSTDYKYDQLYRLIEVKTPNNKHIYYAYDGYGRQIQRQTPDTGIVKFKYDSNNNLVHTQDENQRQANANPHLIFTFRKYDAINRLTILGENSQNLRDFVTIDPDAEEDYTAGDNPDPYYDYLVVNVYDSLSTAAANIFTPPSDYQPTQQNSYYYTKGRLAATAYRTRKTDPWSFKYYKYDERGRVIRMWLVIDGLGTKKIDYTYNSQDQVTNLTSLAGDAELRSFRYRYDIPGRLSHLDIPDDPALENPLYFNLARYNYNQNSLISDLRLNAEQVINTYAYNFRNWIMNCYDNLGFFSYTMDYFPNGNVQSLSLQGNYKSNFPDNNNDLLFNFSYDKSNRLLNATSDYQIQNAHALKNTYDPDGNILTLKRYGSDGTEIDNFNYEYYSGTNKLKKVHIQFADFTYDANGNLKSDDMNRNVIIKYDHRNLITDITHWEYWSEGQIITSRIYYYYDEAGNRIRKYEIRTYFQDPLEPTVTEMSRLPVYNEEEFNHEAETYFNEEQPGGLGEPGGGEAPVVWYLVQNEFYIRGVEGNELVILNGNNVSKYNFYGSGNEGYIDQNGNKFYYLKDHLGSIRVVLDQNNQIISSQDYDAWGYLMPERNFDSNKAKYKFTGKERDKESNYDYFGARYYDSRIGRWGGVDPLLEKHFDFNPYNYVLNNNYIFIDKDGRQTRPLPDPFSAGGGFIAYGTGVIILASGMVMIEISPGVLKLINEIEVIEVTDLNQDSALELRGKLKGIITHVETQVYKHLFAQDKLGGLSPNDPNFNNKRDKWIEDIKRAIRQAYDKFQKIKRKVKNKSIEDFIEKIKEEIGEEKYKKIIEGLEKWGIKIEDIIN